MVLHVLQTSGKTNSSSAISDVFSVFVYPRRFVLLYTIFVHDSQLVVYMLSYQTSSVLCLSTLSPLPRSLVSDARVHEQHPDLQVPAVASRVKLQCTTLARTNRARSVRLTKTGIPAEVRGQRILRKLSDETVVVTIRKSSFTCCCFCCSLSPVQEGAESVTNTTTGKYSCCKWSVLCTVYGVHVGPYLSPKSPACAGAFAPA